MDTDLATQARIADAIEAAANCDMYAAAPPELVRSLNLQSMQIAGATLLMANGIPDPMFSRVIGLGNSGVITDADIEQIETAYRIAGIGSFWVHVNPVIAPRELATKLEQRRFQLAKRRTWAKMIRGTEPTAAVDCTLTIQLAAASEYAIVSQRIAAAFGMPPPFAQWLQALAERPTWTLFAAIDQARIVGGGLLFIDNLSIANRVAWLGMGGVIPEARGRHAHRALMTQRIDIAIDRGCTHIVTETGEPINNEPNPSLRNMYRCGFTRVSSRMNYSKT